MMQLITQLPGRFQRSLLQVPEVQLHRRPEILRGDQARALRFQRIDVPAGTSDTGEQFEERP